jgi:hypothetical protein
MRQQALPAGVVPWTTALTTRQAMSPAVRTALLWGWGSQVASSGRSLMHCSVSMISQVEFTMTACNSRFCCLHLLRSKPDVHPGKSASGWAMQRGGASCSCSCS